MTTLAINAGPTHAAFSNENDQSRNQSEKYWNRQSRKHNNFISHGPSSNPLASRVNAAEDFNSLFSSMGSVQKTVRA